MNNENTNDMRHIRLRSGGAESISYLSSGRNSSRKSPLVIAGILLALVLGCLAGLAAGYWLWEIRKTDFLSLIICSLQRIPIFVIV